MTKKELKLRLNSFVYINIELNQLYDSLQNTRDRMTSIRSSSNIGEIPGSSGNNDKISESIAKLCELESMYSDNLNKILDEKVWIESIIEDLTPVERLLMRARYIDGEVWESVCCKINYSWNHTHRLHNKILDKILKMLKDGTQCYTNVC